MRRRRTGRKAHAIAAVAVTPVMRRRVEEVARWLAAGDKSQMPAATQALLDLLCEAARPTNGFYPSALDFYGA